MKYKSAIATTTVYLFLAALFVHLPISPDHAIFDYIGWSSNDGLMLYRDIADQNWPGQMFIHKLSTYIFGSQMWSFRLFEVLLIIPLSCLILLVFVRKLLPNSSHAWLIIPLYAVMYMTAGRWMAGQREIIVAPFLIASAYTMWCRFDGHPKYTLILQGVLIVAATLIRPTMLIMAPLITLADLLMAYTTHRKWKTIVADHSIVALSVIVFLGLVAMIAFFTGSLKYWYQISILFNMEVYSFSSSQLDIFYKFFQVSLGSWHWYIIWAIIGIICGARHQQIPFVLISLIIPATLISAAVQGQGFGYHFLPVLPVLAICIVVTLDFSITKLSTNNCKNPMFYIAILLLIIPVLGFVKKTHTQLSPQAQYLLGKIDRQEMYQQYSAGEGIKIDEVVELSNYISSTTDKDETILMWARPTHVYNLTRIRSPFFAASHALLFNPTEDFSEFDAWYAELSRIMKNTPPQVIMLRRNDDNGYHGLTPTNEGKKFSNIITESLSNYQLEKSFSTIDLYRLN